ncbi:vacuolar protein-sorting-associated protein 33 [Carex littledalei]|uniref:Vacuolar protein-sorting-associated protein 33 n=1 Tax=Carex littledalei TaxID=544730 RepID=A0A833QGQ3_9POAL|nr:vacuolar protein-sorting-associated protein 33 [Carex littledalei]
MAQIPNLDNAPLNFNAIREKSQKDLLDILQTIRGKKCLVIDPKLGGTLSMLIQFSRLKEGDGELRHLSADPVQTDSSNVVYLIRPQLTVMKTIASHIQNDISKGVQKKYFIYFVPRRTVACEKILEEEKVHNLVSLGEYPLYMVPLDEDVISFELELSLKGAPEINTLILLDREVDLVTPMCLQLTYEGLLDELLQINNGAVEVDASIMGAPQDAKKMKVPLNSSDKLYKEIRDLNFEVVVQVLRQKTTSIKEEYAGVKTTTEISELKDFVKKLNSLPEISRHVNLAQHLQSFTSKPSFHARLDIEQTILELQDFDSCFEYIEEMIHKQESIVSVLRLLVLFSLTNAGLPKKHFDYLRREILHSYGFEHMQLLYNLEKAGLFKRQETRTNWLSLTKGLQLINEETDTANPNDISYIFSGYAPLSIRLVQHAIRSGWRSIEELLKLLPGPHLDLKRGTPNHVDTFTGAQSDRVPDGRRSLVFVVFIGGVTFAEIAALRFLSSQEGMGYDFIVGTTRVVSGNSILEAIVGNSG